MTDLEQSTDDAEDQAQNTKSKKGKLIIIASAALVLLLGGGAGAAYFLGLFGGDESVATEAGDHSTDEAEASPEGAGGTADGEASASDDSGDQASDDLVFVDLPDVLVNLNSSGKRMRFLKMRVALEAPDQQVANRIKKLMPRIMDSFQMYLRALTIDEVSSPASLHRLKEELMARTNYAISPNRIDDVLVKELLVQ